mmetsp:Transcript_115127/g.298516  ORF Transcript_115127/g.298516 Transcript_115127/m.298516 type:complete len:201 (+) Transcript_115127:144-746(+)
MCRTRTVPSVVLPPAPAVVRCRLAAGSSGLDASTEIQTALVQQACASESIHQRSADALGCLAKRAVDAASCSSLNAAVAPHSNAIRQRPFGKTREAVSGLISTSGYGARRSRAPIAQLVDKPSRKSASWRGSASAVKPRRSVATASRHTASARSKSGAALLSVSNLFQISFEALSASSASSVPSKATAPARVRTSHLNTR